jgi:hypothetical protein
MLHWNYGHLRADGDGWLFEGGQPAGSMTFRFRLGTPQGRSAPSTGSFRAESTDAGWAPAFAPSGVRVEVDGATFQGELSQPGLLGRITGSIVFAGADGTRATCSEVSLSMSPGLP